MKARYLAAALLLAATPAAATTYTYEGGLYTSNTDPLTFGERLTGTVTFAFDTSSITGILSGNSVESFSLSSGPFTTTGTIGFSFGLQNGVPINWVITAGIFCGDIEIMGCLITSMNNGRESFDIIQHNCHFCPPGFEPGGASGPFGAWTMASPAAVPGPVVGAGLPGLMMLIAWLMARRRCTRSC